LDAQPSLTFTPEWIVMPRTVPTNEFSPAFAPASDRQIQYVADLLRQKDHQTCIPGVNSRPLTLPLPDPLSKEQASQLITWLRNRPAKLAVVPDATPPEVKEFWAHNEDTPVRPSGVLTEGSWIDGDHHYLVTRTRNDLGWNVKVWTPDTVEGEWREAKTGTWEYVGGGAALPASARLATLDQATAFAHRFGRCCVCGRKLTVRESRDAGMGPDCASKVAG
jgi:hypothetical protein